MAASAADVNRNETRSDHASSSERALGAAEVAVDDGDDEWSSEKRRSSATTSTTYFSNLRKSRREGQKSNENLDSIGRRH